MLLKSKNKNKQPPPKQNKTKTYQVDSETGAFLEKNELCFENNFRLMGI